MRNIFLIYMTVYLGILGDPAKLEMYDSSFYNLFDASDSLFYLLGASENDVTKKQYNIMYKRLISSNSSVIKPLNLFTNNKTINSRIGLFPSSSKHLIKGPGFAFGSFPANSKSNYLKFKAKLIIKLLSPFLSHDVIPLAYFPHGGKAGNKTKANTDLTLDELVHLFKKYRKNPWFKWFYLEAGSGQDILSTDKIQAILYSQLPSEQYNLLSDNSFIVPNTIYGGGIDSINKIEHILYPKCEKKLIPQCIIIGNISEYDIDTTMKIIDRVNEFNEKNA